MTPNLHGNSDHHTAPPPPIPNPNPLFAMGTYFGREKTRNGNAGRQANGDGHRGNPQRHVVRGAKVERYKGQPDDTRCVHGKACKEIKRADDL